MSTTVITRPTCATCWFYISVSADASVGECREEAPKAGTLAAAPTVKATYWCGQFVLPPAGAITTVP